MGETEYQRNREPDLATAQSGLGSEPRPDTELKDLPPPIFYDDEFGKASLVFTGPRGLDPMKPIAIVYTEYDNKKKTTSQVRLDDYLSRGFYFVRNPKSRFSTLTTDGDPVVFFSWKHLNTSRKFLFALAHEMRHTHQAEPIRKLLEIVRSKSPQETRETVQQLKRELPQLEEYISDLYNITMVARTTGKKRDEIARNVRNHGGRGVDLQGLTPNLPDDFDGFLQDMRGLPTSLGPIHPAGYFFRNPTLSKFPAVFHIVDPMAERMAWETAMLMDRSFQGSGVIQCGFHSIGERAQFMYSGLSTYDQRYRVDNYSRWLRSLVK